LATTPDYVFGALKSVPRSLGSAGYQNSGNRWMGVTFASTADAVLAIFGNGTGGSARGYAEIVGEAKSNAMVIAKDPSATANIGTRIFISHSVAVLNEGGWHFARAGNGYAAFRIANKSISGITTSPVDSTPVAGVMLELEDQWSPVAFQMGRASDFNPSVCSNPSTPAAQCAAARYAAFRSAVIANPARFTYDSANKKLTYVSLANETYVIYSGQNYTANLAAYPLPAVNGDASVNPTKTYDSPYISGTHGQDTVTLSYGSHPPLVLDFTY
jgi:hypothetical protein